MQMEKGKMIKRYRLIPLYLLLLAIVPMGCKKLYNLPENKDFLSENINYSNKVLEPILGRTNLMGNISSDNSTLPLQFEIVNARYGDGRPVTDLFQTRPVYVWTAEYDGLEKSLEEIEAKRKIEERPLFEVRESGQFIMWNSATNDLVQPRPIDSSDLAQDIRFFDLKVSNSGGEIILKDFRVRPWRERPYEPSNDINHYTGAVARDPRDPANPFKRDFIRPRLSNVIGENTDRALITNDERKDVVVYIRPVEGGSGNKLRFKFLRTDSTEMDPALFNETRWDKLVHGFNMVKTSEYVEYDVAYPIPLVNIPTEYTNGSSAKVNFSYARRAFGGGVTTATFGLDFRIFQPGHWEIVFHFRTDNPKFEDE